MDKEDVGYTPTNTCERRSVVSDSLWPYGLQPARLHCPWNSLGQNTGMGSCSLLQGNFLTQESNQCLLHCRRILYQLSYPGSGHTCTHTHAHTHAHTHTHTHTRRMEYCMCCCYLVTAAAAAAKSLQSCLTLCDPIDGLQPGSPVPGTLQARTLEWVAMSFSNAWKWKVKVKSLSHVQLVATPWTAAHQAPPSMGFSRQEYWSGVPLPSPLLSH